MGSKAQGRFDFVKWIPASVERGWLAARPRATIGKGRTISLNVAAVELLVGHPLDAIGADYTPLSVALYYDARNGAVAVGMSDDAEPLICRRRKQSSRQWTINATAFCRAYGLGGDARQDYDVWLEHDGLIAFQVAEDVRGAAVPPPPDDDIPF